MKKILLFSFALLFFTGCKNEKIFIEEAPKKENFIKETIECLNLWELRKNKLFGEEIGNYKVIFNPNLKTCIVGNVSNEVYNDKSSKYSIFVADLIKDEILFDFILYDNETKDSKGLTIDEAWKKYEEFGLIKLEKENKESQEKFKFDLNLSSLNYELPNYDLICTPERRVVCNEGICSESNPTVFLLYDESQKILHRCDSKPCDSYLIEDWVSGIYRNLKSMDKDVRVKIQDSVVFPDTNGNYVEITGSGLGVMLNFGKCEAISNK